MPITPPSHSYRNADGFLCDPVRDHDCRFILSARAGAFYEPAFVFENYARFLTGFFGGILGFSIGLAALVAVVSVVLAFPFTYILTRMSRQAQVVWLVFLLSVLSLSEVLIGFGWSTLLSRTLPGSPIFWCR